MAKKMGYQGLLYYGTKGATAATQVLSRVDATYELTAEVGSTTSAGDGTKVPINTGEATAINCKFSFNMIVADDDNAVVEFKAHSGSETTRGVPIALRFVQWNGTTGLDADCIISVKQGVPLKGEQTLDIDVIAISESDRDPILNG